MAAGLYDITTETLGKGHFAVVKLAKHCLTGQNSTHPNIYFLTYLFQESQSPSRSLTRQNSTRMVLSN